MIYNPIVNVFHKASFTYIFIHKIRMRCTCTRTQFLSQSYNTHFTHDFKCNLYDLKISSNLLYDFTNLNVNAQKKYSRRTQKKSRKGAGLR